jgi:hypothetical protein
MAVPGACDLGIDTAMTFCEMDEMWGKKMEDREMTGGRVGRRTHSQPATVQLWSTEYSQPHASKGERRQGQGGATVGTQQASNRHLTGTQEMGSSWHLLPGRTMDDAWPQPLKPENPRGLPRAEGACLQAYPRLGAPRSGQRLGVRSTEYAVLRRVR